MHVRFTALVRGAFSSDPHLAHQDIEVDTATGEVRVWDSVADHYTTCHSLTASQQRRLRYAPVVKAARRAKASTQ